MSVSTISSYNFNILHLTDIHGAVYLIDKIDYELSTSDLVIISGDITHFGGTSEVENIINKIKILNSKILAVPGNCDTLKVQEYLNEISINLHNKLITFNNFNFTGFGGSLPCPGKTPIEYTEKEYENFINSMDFSIKPNSDLIVVSHQPPHKTLNDKLLFGMHVGSKTLRNFILNKKPLLYLTGHIHEGIGVDTVYGCKIVNPGPFRSGKYAKIKISDEKNIDIQLKQITAN
ncbi:MAG: metallophosphoesterase [Bacteroidales bacterium]|nr:metallophosphoesterase [Bacteroidales bacterium]